MTDIYENNSTGLDSPGVEHYDITPHNSNDEAIAFRSIWVGVAGNVSLVSMSCAAGSIIPMRGKRVNNTGTTATDLIGIY